MTGAQAWRGTIIMPTLNSCSETDTIRRHLFWNTYLLFAYFHASGGSFNVQILSLKSTVGTRLQLGSPLLYLALVLLQAIEEAWATWQ